MTTHQTLHPHPYGSDPDLDGHDRDTWGPDPYDETYDIFEEDDRHYEEIAVDPCPEDNDSFMDAENTVSGFRDALTIDDPEERLLDLQDVLRRCNIILNWMGADRHSPVYRMLQETMPAIESAIKRTKEEIETLYERLDDPRVGLRATHALRSTRTHGHDVFRTSMRRGHGYDRFGNDHETFLHARRLAEDIEDEMREDSWFSPYENLWRAARDEAVRRVRRRQHLARAIRRARKSVARSRYDLDDDDMITETSYA